MSTVLILKIRQDYEADTKALSEGICIIFVIGAVEASNPTFGYSKNQDELLYRPGNQRKGPNTSN